MRGNMSREIHSFSPEVEKGAENQVAAVGSIQAEEDAREAETNLDELSKDAKTLDNTGRADSGVELINYDDLLKLIFSVESITVW